MIVREYTSARAFHHDAQELYTREGYTVANTNGLAGHSYVRRVLGFFGLRQEHLVITYQPPTNVRLVNTNRDEQRARRVSGSLTRCLTHCVFT